MQTGFRLVNGALDLLFLTSDSDVCRLFGVYMKEAKHCVVSLSYIVQQKMKIG